MYEYKCVFVGHTIEPCKKTAVPFKMPFFLGGGQTRLSPRKRVLDWVYVGATWRIRVNDPYSVAMRAVATITVATCSCIFVLAFRAFASRFREPWKASW